MRPQVVSLAVLAALAQPAWSTDIQPGLWELSVTTRAVASTDAAPSPNTINQCLTAQDAQDPSRVLGSTANSEASNCTYTEKNFSGSTFRFRMQCAGSLGYQAKGEVTYSATSMEGSITSTVNLGGQLAELQSRVTARRLGGC